MGAQHDSFLPHGRRPVRGGPSAVVDGMLDALGIQRPLILVRNHSMVGRNGGLQGDASGGNVRLDDLAGVLGGQGRGNEQQRHSEKR